MGLANRPGDDGTRMNALSRNAAIGRPKAPGGQRQPGGAEAAAQRPRD
jgi:hypothetical protein